MIYEFFSFYNEFDMLELKLQEHDAYVDQFVITEANKTYNQIDKPYRLQSQWKKYKKWHHKITYLKFDATGSDPGWPTEHAQREWPMSQVDLRDEDIIIISDLDEFLRPIDWDNLKLNINKGKREILFEMECYWCYANVHHKLKQRALCAVQKKNYIDALTHRRPMITFQMLPNPLEKTQVMPGGVHLTWMGDRETFEQKLMGSIEGYNWSQGRTPEEMWHEKNTNSLFSHKAKFKKSKLEMVALEHNTMFTDSMKTFITKQPNWLLCLD